MPRFFRQISLLPAAALSGLAALTPLYAQTGTPAAPWQPAASADKGAESEARYVSQGMLGPEIFALRFIKPKDKNELSFALFDPRLDTIPKLLDTVRHLEPGQKSRLMLYGLCDNSYAAMSGFSDRSIEDFNFCDQYILDQNAVLDISILLDAKELREQGISITEVSALALKDGQNQFYVMARLRDMDLYVSEGGPTETLFGEINFAASAQFRYAEDIRQCGRILTSQQQEDLSEIHVLREATAGKEKITGFEASLMPSFADRLNADHNRIEDLERYLGFTGDFCTSCYDSFQDLAGGLPGQICDADAGDASFISVSARLPWSVFTDTLLKIRGENATQPEPEGWKFALILQKSDGAEFDYAWRGEGMLDALLTGRDGLE